MIVKHWKIGTSEPGKREPGEAYALQQGDTGILGITLTAAMRGNLLQLQQTARLMNRTQGRISFSNSLLLKAQGMP